MKRSLAAILWNKRVPFSMNRRAAVGVVMFDPNAIGLHPQRSHINFGACIIAGLRLAQGSGRSVSFYSMRSASLNGSKTPFWSLPLSKPVSDSARMLTSTSPAMSTRFAIAFQAP